MKSFLKYTLATITGIIVTSILFTVIMIVTLGAMIASSDKPVSIDDNSILVLNTGAIIPERGSSDPFSSFDPIEMSFKPAAGINDILGNLEKASRDNRIKGVLIENGPMINGYGKASEIRNAILKFRESGKFVISYTDYILTQEAYHISTAAEKIWISPVAMVEFKGISSDIMFYTGALEKIGVEVQVIRHGKFKGAVEPYMNRSLSPENRSQIERFTGGIWETMLSDISESRGISIDQLNLIADSLLAYDTQKAIDLGMIEGKIYRDQLLEELETITGAKPEMVSMTSYKNASVPDKTEHKGRVAVVYAEGSIVMGKGSSTNIGGDSYAKLFRTIRENDKYDAVVLRVNSPGGNAMASDLIWREVALTAEKIPVVVSMSNYAASGGYYISAPATVIYAQSSTLTGSIGIYARFPQAGALLENKLGITTESVKTNRYADSPSLIRPMDNNEEVIMQQNIDRGYNDFISRVSVGRDISLEEVDAMGEGHVFYGDDALANGLIDKIGGLDDAIAEAASLAGLESYRITELPEEEDPYTKLLKSLSGEIKTSVIERELGVNAIYWKDINELRSLTGIQARLPYFLILR
ncbi:MAG: signal peptide peptidase SppA [Bacteroidales bacterium]|nr:signal peptide peptidase SppA [Bacteroidales bacterium]